MTAHIPEKLARTAIDPAAYQDGAMIDAAFDELRRDYGFAKAELDEYPPIWFATRHADILAIEMRAADFQNGPRASTLLPNEMQNIVRFLTDGDSNFIHTLVGVDGAEHKALRSIVFPAMTPQAVRTMEDKVRATAAQYAQMLFDQAPSCDFAADVAFYYPLRVIMGVLGVPQEDELYLLELTQQLFGSTDPEMNRSKTEVTPKEALDQVVEINAAMEAYFGKVTEDFRKQPDDAKVNSLIANATIDGEYLNRRQLMGYYIIAATAGHDTTSNATAAAMWELAARPGLLAELQADPGLIGAFVEESIRWSTPVKHFMRTAVADSEFAGHQIAAGDYIFLSYHSANRDDAVFERPYDFDIHRKPNKQIAFGYGPHVCLGQHLARLEMRLLWEAIIPRLASVELNGTPERTRSMFVCGPKHVPIKFTLKQDA
ncbi:MAG: cytochrome P450 [Sphingomonadaceae bacterium]|nr:cytochrome P450 [Sphingomonadaceae bacterium]